MALTANDDAAATAYSTGTLAATIAVATGDLIVVFAGVLREEVFCTGVTDDIGNSYTVRSELVPTGQDCSLVMAYCLASEGTDATNAITLSYGDATNSRKMIIATSWTIDGGDTVTLDDASNITDTYQATGEWVTPADEIDTTGTDELVIAGYQAGSSGSDYTNAELPPGTGATEISNNDTGDCLFYVILTETIADADATVESDAGASYSAEILAFKSAGAAPPAGQPYFKRFGGVPHSITYRRW